MVCYVVRFKKTENDSPAWGVLENNVIYPLQGKYSTTRELINDGKEEAFALLSTENKISSIYFDDVLILPPITKPCLVLCQGANYRDHMIESGMNPDDKNFNMIFNKSAASITGAMDNIIKPDHVELLDYEVELGLVIGRDISKSENITEEQLSQYVAGIVIGNDVSARDVQVPQMQFFKGKSYRSFCPVGPVLCLLTEDEMDYVNNLELTLTVNDEVRQRDNTRNLVFKPAETLSELSQITDMHVGDLVMTGTPAGCAMRIPPQLIQKIGALLPEPVKWKLFKKMQSRRKEYLNPGDIVRTTIRSMDGAIDLGAQENRVV